MEKYPVKILHVCSSDDGGAGIAMRRLHRALLSSGVDSSCLVFRKTVEDSQVQSVLGSSILSHYERAGHALTHRLLRAMGFSSRSIAVWPTTALQRINSSDADVIHLHWINAEMISIAQLAHINKPVVWTFHDMWPFCGAEHYTFDTRYKSGYQERNPDIRFDLDRWVFRRKKKRWAKWRPTVVTPSRWLSDCAEESELFGSREIHTVANCMDMDVFKPAEASEARRRFGLPTDKHLILFGACNVHDPRKGGDLLRSALSGVEDKARVELVVFGSEESLSIEGFRVHSVGRISQEKVLAELYSAVDVMCVPSRQEAFGQTASEPLACGTPVVVFGCSGLLDIVEHKVNGYLAKPFDARDFSQGIDWVLRASRENPAALKNTCRQSVKGLCSPDRVATAYQTVYEQVIDEKGVLRV